MSEYWGYGYDEEVLRRILELAFEDLKLEKVVAKTQAANKSSCKL